jgi:hypothetical protein
MPCPRTSAQSWSSPRHSPRWLTTTCTRTGRTHPLDCRPSTLEVIAPASLSYMLTCTVGAHSCLPASGQPTAMPPAVGPPTARASASKASRTARARSLASTRPRQLATASPPMAESDVLRAPLVAVHYDHRHPAWRDVNAAARPRCCPSAWVVPSTWGGAVVAQHTPCRTR